MRQRGHCVLSLIPLLLALGCDRQPQEITEAKARSIAEKQMDQYCGGEGGKCTDFYFKGQHAPEDERFKWAFHWLSEFTDPRRLMIVMVGATGETAVRIKNAPPPTSEEMAATVVAEAAPGGETAPTP